MLPELTVTEQLNSSLNLRAIYMRHRTKDIPEKITTAAVYIKNIYSFSLQKYHAFN